MGLLRLRAGQVGLHQQRRVVQQLVLPLAQRHLAFDQAAHHADVLGPADGVAAHEAVAAELQAQVTALRGVTQINVLDTLGLVSASFGAWDGVPGGQHVEMTDRDADGGKGRHLSLQFGGDRLVGCNSIGWTEHVGVMRGLVEGQVSLGAWKDKLLQDPTLLMQAYLASAQAQHAHAWV